MKRSLQLGALFALLAATSALDFGCAGKSTGTRASNQPPAAAAPKTDAALTTEGSGPYLVPLAEQRRWSYSALPTPAPSSKPNYLLRSVGFAKSSSTLDNEGRGTLKGLAEVLQEKTKIRVLCLGLADGGPEKVNAENVATGRAQAARQALISAGVSKDRIETAIFGASQAQAQDPIGQELERVVEVWLLTE